MNDNIENDFITSCGYNSVEQVQSFIDNGVNVNACDEFGNTALMAAIKAKSYKIADLLIACGADLNQKDDDGNTALLRIFYNQFAGIEDIQYLIEKGADPNVINSNGETALVLALCRKNNEESEFLLNNGADPNFRDKNGNTLLMIYYYELDDYSVFNKLIEVGADVNAINDDGETPLMFASSAGLLYRVQGLLDFGADVNTKDNKGNNALMHALKLYNPVDEKLEEYHVDIVNTLINAGIDINAKNNNDETPSTIVQNESYFYHSIPNEGEIITILSGGKEFDAKKKIDHTKIEDTIIGVVTKLMGDEIDISTDTSFAEDIELNELDRVFLVMEIESEFDIKISDDEAVIFDSVRDLKKLVEDKI